jgi:hypothetical protein
LPSGSWRARVYAGVDPITQREIRLKATAKTEQQAYIELGRLLKEASEGRTPDSDATVAKLLDEYAAVAPWDVSTRQTNEGFIRRTIKPALGHLEVRKVRGPILDQLYSRLKRCGDLSCTGRHVAFSYVVRGGQRIRKDTKTHQDRWLAIDQDTCALIASYLGEIRTELATVGAELSNDAFLFSNDPAHSRPWNPDWATHKVAEAAVVARAKLDIKGGRHYTASQLLAGGFDLRNTAARLGHSGGGATTLRHYADPVPEVDRRAAAYLAKLTAGSAAQSSR